MSADPFKNMNKTDKAYITGLCMGVGALSIAITLDNILGWIGLIPSMVINWICIIWVSKDL